MTDLSAVFNYANSINKSLDRAPHEGVKPEILRILKLAEEVGETTESLICYLGNNIRKDSVSKSEVAKELCDVIITAMVALIDWTAHPEERLADRIAYVAQRLRNAEENLELH